MTGAPGCWSDPEGAGRRPLVGTPRTFLFRAFLVTIASLVVGLFVPGAVARHQGVFFLGDLEDRMNRTPDLAAALERYRAQEQQRGAIDAAIDRIDARFMASSAEATFAGALELAAMRDRLVARRASLKDGVVLSPFYLGSTMHLWPTLFLTLGSVTTLVASGGVLQAVRSYTVPRTLLLLICVDFMYRWPSWMRNLWLLNKERRVTYGDTNPDVSCLAYVVQEILAFIVAALLTCVLVQWIALHEELERESVVVTDVRRLSFEFARWQVASALLAVGFVVYSTFFWHAVFVNGDGRYVIHAIVVQCLWACVWGIVSWPFVAHYARWLEARARRIHEILQEADATSVKNRLEALEYAEPVTPLALAASSAFALGSFAWPALSALAEGVL